MSVTATCLVDAQYVSNTTTTYYTAPSSTRAIIDLVTVTNRTGGAVTIDVYLVPLADSADDENKIIRAESVAAGATVIIEELKGQVLETGDFLSCTASAGGSLVLRVSGREIS